MGREGAAHSPNTSLDYTACMKCMSNVYEDKFI